jgi:hypothetical protein
MSDSKNYFKDLNAIDCSDKIEKKNGLSYLSWAFAWAEVKKYDPNANYTIYENTDGWNYFTDGRTCWVKTGVTVNGIEHIEYLPVMDFRNKSIPLESVTSFDVNKTIQRSLTKAVARHGLGLYIYAGEDLPEESEAVQTPTPKTKSKKTEPVKSEPVPAPEQKTTRDILRELCKKNGIDTHTVIQVCGLNPNSTDEDYLNAIAYVKQNLGAW